MYSVYRYKIPMDSTNISQLGQYYMQNRQDEDFHKGLNLLKVSNVLTAEFHIVNIKIKISYNANQHSKQVLKQVKIKYKFYSKFFSLQQGERREWEVF